jgi:hypothetical protein
VAAGPGEGMPHEWGHNVVAEVRQVVFKLHMHTSATCCCLCQCNTRGLRDLVKRWAALAACKYQANMACNIGVL